MGRRDAYRPPGRARTALSDTNTPISKITYMQERQAAKRYRTLLPLLLLLLLSLSLLLRSMSAAAASASPAPNDDDNASKNPLMLEAGPSSSVDEIVHKLDMSSGSASIELGPLVVNEDGEGGAAEVASTAAHPGRHS